ncbi:carboxymuconolactone decarboxylase family protein [Cryobacterium frigoriphilum]|uniref:Carboxymuconolactone decarboxylase family protein n=1 Tax=Cryobacterium frigoriphilum TaxID=1259150 RepID=A0A4R8ZU88_9MICO|nr:carboxymuconolactone decarboxylase family protein [Cryobacterium frigoriphilum]TFD45973.1 carboxymuconolactone decarboxylase family protein [Cryobacterium frigoriphilum]
MAQSSVGQAEIDRQAAALMVGLPAGPPLDAMTETLIGLAIRASAMSLDVDGSRRYIERALAGGSTFAQVQEVITLVSGTGVHSFFEATRILDSLVTEPGAPPWDDERQRLWDTYVGEGGRWATMQEEIPGFLAALNRMSPEAFEAFFLFCAVPWRSRHLSNLTKELISVAVDANPSHRYLPGMRLHLRNAIRLGAGRAALEHTLRIAAVGPAPHGVL